MASFFEPQICNSRVKHRSSGRCNFQEPVSQGFNRCFPSARRVRVRRTEDAFAFWRSEGVGARIGVGWKTWMGRVRS